MQLCLLLCPLPTLSTYTCRRLLDFCFLHVAIPVSTLMTVSLNYHYSYHHILPTPSIWRLFFLTVSECLMLSRIWSVGHSFAMHGMGVYWRKRKSRVLELLNLFCCQTHKLCYYPHMVSVPQYFQ
ncbi:uncharacterized protein BO87DRAFT_120800 [Aspergillus neoniger CBS 115656]|uniref:Uncharacterized protein n=1 Tax=Aspergillus neoniger (strain CBS 115656) TaxID=1448310 RepID=A0A318YCS3_ASPNB|nr:hypothetical protein BO87DRAFT_120800 [Aspergillus neoniger CBS 115656]PYH31794.1 hypothetical protein BO87DRAFT_120800 [Aspergillus neoniger CBS 115656]